MQPKFNLTATLYAKPEKRAELLKLLTSFVDKSRSEQGCVDYHFHVSLDDPNMFYFYENWTERADFDRHITLDYQRTGSPSRANIWPNPSNSVSSRW
jgi:quinol monooxygenase YgiN